MFASFPRAVARFGEAALEERSPRRRTPVPRRPMPARRPELLIERPARRVVVRLWLPVTALFWLLSPFPLVLAPLAYLAPPQFRPANPYAAVFAVGRLLISLGGTVVDVDTPDALVRIRVF